MKPPVYLALALLLIPLHGSLFAPVAVAGITPDAVLIAVYVIGLLTGPREAMLAGVCLGLLQDIHSAGILGVLSITRGLTGLAAGILGRHVLNIASLSNIPFLMAFSIAEAVLAALFIGMAWGSVPFFSMLFGHMIPKALSTAVAGTLLLRLISRGRTVQLLTRPSLQKE